MVSQARGLPLGASLVSLSQAMAVSQEISSMVRGWLMASPSAKKRKQPPDYVPISPRPERCETKEFQSTHSHHVVMNSGVYIY